MSAVPMRWADMDAFGHVNNVVYLRYLQEARVELLFHRAAERGHTGLAEGVVVARHDLEDRAPLRCRPSPISVQTWVQRIGAASFTLGYEIFDDVPSGDARAAGIAGTAAVSTGRTVYVSASSVLVPYDLQAARPRRISPEERSLLEEYSR